MQNRATSHSELVDGYSVGWERVKGIAVSWLVALEEDGGEKDSVTPTSDPM